jgi:hypothetical protein
MCNERRFYTYAFLRRDGTPYYIGKGSGKRIYSKGGRACGTPKDISRIIFLKQNLTEGEAFKHEAYMIAVFGRKDLGTGILNNRTDGGEGSSGAIRPPELREKISQTMKGRTFTEEHKKNLSTSRRGKRVSEETKRRIGAANKGKVLSEETKRKMSESHKGIAFSEERKQNIRKSKIGKSTSLKGKTYEEIYGECYLERIEKLRMCNTGKVMSEETKQKISNSKKGSSAWNKGKSMDSKYVYKLLSPDGEIVVTKNLSYTCKENGLNVTCMRRLMNGEQKQHKGWTFLERTFSGEAR